MSDIKGVGAIIVVMLYIIFLPVLYDLIVNASEFFVEATLYLKGK